MALFLENALLVRQKVKIAMGIGVGADPSIVESGKELFNYLATQRKNANLQFIPVTAEQLVTNAGVALTDAACKIIAVYWKGRRTTGTTSSFVSLTSVDQAGEVLDATRFKAVTNSAVLKLYPAGLAVETALHGSAATTIGGATESATADAADGFVIIAAA